MSIHHMHRLDNIIELIPPASLMCVSIFSKIEYFNIAKIKMSFGSSCFFVVVFFFFFPEFT